VREPLLARLKRISRSIGAPFALPDTGIDEGTWYELRPDGIPSIAVAKPQRYADREAAEQAAGRLRAKHPDFQFVEIVRYDAENGRRSPATTVGRV
jgi:hypothetical protein